MKYLSLCIPTNGISEWVFPVLDNIYNQKIEQSLWEVVVTNNGNNEDFHKQMISYALLHNNLIYEKTDAYLFENQIYALRLASGEYFKFMNHRSILEPDAIKWMIEQIKDVIEEKPIMYFSNGVLKLKKTKKCNSFDEFIYGLREFASWTTGVGVWKSDFERIPRDWKYNKISPHSDVLFWERHRNCYLIDDTVWCHDIDTSNAKKGKYDLYKTFGVEEPYITIGLYIDGDISARTCKYVIRCYEKRLSVFYAGFNILHQICSYNINGFNEIMGILMNKRRVLIGAYLKIPKIVVLSLCHKVKNNFIKRCTLC